MLNAAPSSPTLSSVFMGVHLDILEVHWGVLRTSLPQGN